MTQRESIDSNKLEILNYLQKRGSNTAPTAYIAMGYGGESDMRAVRKALNELRKEGKVKTDDRTHGYLGKFWELVK